MTRRQKVVVARSRDGASIGDEETRREPTRIAEETRDTSMCIRHDMTDSCCTAYDWLNIGVIMAVYLCIDMDKLKRYHAQNWLKRVKRA